MQNYNNFLFKNYYFMNSYLTFENEIKYYIIDRNVNLRVFQKFHEGLNQNIFKRSTSPKDSLSIYIKYDETILKDGYLLDINHEKIIIKASNDRGAHYAIDTINKLIITNNNLIKLPIILIDDEPSFEFRGIIEGFYDTPWTKDEHFDMFSYMFKKRLNTYMYAPKDEIYHREKWYAPYPKENIKHFKNMLNAAKENHVDFWYTISPGYLAPGEEPFEYIDEKDFERLFRKIDQLIEIGVNNFGLLLDDIDYQLSPKNEAIFKRPGVAHAYISNRFYEYISSKIPHANIVMCPTEYHQIGGSVYRNDLKDNLNDKIKVFYTGDCICAEAITTEDMKDTKEGFGKELFIWDNFPVSDFTKRSREYIAPIKNRTVDLNKYATGYIINPSLHYHISKVGMSTMADFAWNSHKYDSNKSFIKALKDVSIDFYNLGMPFINFNYPSVLDHGNLDYEKYLVDNLLKDEILNYYEEAVKSANALNKLELPIIEELKPWLNRLPKELLIVKKILNDKLSKDELVEFLRDDHAFGSEILDYLVVKKDLLTDEEYNKLTTKHRGSNWYRVFETRRWIR